MIDAIPDAPVLLLVEDVAKLLGLPETCFYVTVGSRVLRDCMSLAAEGVGSDSVIRVCAGVRAGMQPVNGGFRGDGFGGGGDFGQWTCTNPQCRANRCWPTKSKCFRCGAPKGYGLTQDPGRPPYPPPGWQPREQHHPGRPVQVSPGIAPTKKAAKSARREAAATAASGFLTPVPLTKVQALELLKGDLDGELFLELQTRLAKPKVVSPKKKEDAPLRKRIEKDKAKDLQARLEQRLSNLRGELASVEAQHEEQRQRVLVLQSEWQALYDQAGEETDDKVEEQLSQGNLESDGMEATDDERIPLGDSDGFLTVLSRHGRKKQRRRLRKMIEVERIRRKLLTLPLHRKRRVTSWTRLILCSFVTTCLIASLWTSLRERCKIWQTVCFTPLRKRPMSVVVRRREERLSSAFRNKGDGRWEGGLSRTSVGKVKVKSKKSSNSLLFPVTKKKSCFNFQSLLSGPTDFNFFHPPDPRCVWEEGDSFLSSWQRALRCDTGPLSCTCCECLFWFLSFAKATYWNSWVCLWRSY